MVCIAAFIILCIVSVGVGLLSLVPKFRERYGRKFWAVFKKSWGCVGKRVTLQKCETNFKEDVKNSILRKVVIRKPKLVKPIGIAIEILSVLVVLITVWSLLEGAKAGLSLYALGTCSPARPDACVAAATDICPATNTRLNWFEEWGEIFGALPDRLKTWEAADYLPATPVYYAAFDAEKPVALDVFDPGCDKCLQSFRNQLEAGLMASHNVALLPYPTEAESRDYRFNNAYLISTYILALGRPEFNAVLEPLPEHVNTGWRIIQRLFTEFSPEGVVWQSVLKAETTSAEEARKILEGWLTEWGYGAEEVTRARELAAGEETMQQLAEIREIVKTRIHVIGVPTTIYDGKKHTGVFTSE
jgi:hypothetical protein